MKKDLLALDVVRLFASNALSLLTLTLLVATRLSTNCAAIGSGRA